jgi:hypothetical protein
MKNTYVNIKKRCFIILMTLVVSIGLMACKSSKSNAITPGSSILPAPSKSVTEASTTNVNEIQFAGVLTYLNTSDYKMHLVDIDTGTEYEVAYTGGTDIKDKYKQIIAAINMKMGAIYDVTCNKSGKAVSIFESATAWEVSNITDFTIEENSRKITAGASSYNYDSHAVVLSNANKISVAQLVPQDEVTIRGVDNTVYSISVDAGHGYITFTGITSFIGGYASLGTKKLYQVTDNMLATAPEGTYTVEMQKGSLTGYKTVTVSRDQQITVDFSECTTEATKSGAVKFLVTPANAIMSIDGVEVDYSEPLSLSYGKHRVVLSANHYERYVEVFTVNSVYQTKVIDMNSSSGATSSTSSTSATKGSSSTTSANLTDGYSVNVTEPKGAALYVDSVYIGIVPCTFDKTKGNKTITLSKSGYATVSYTISIANATGNLTYSFPDMVEK